MVDKLGAAESTFKELQLRMADPEIANNAAEFQKVRKMGTSHALRIKTIFSITFAASV